MRKILGSIGVILFLGGCVSSKVDIDKQIRQTNIDKTLMKKYHITSDDLINFGDYYVFATPSPNGTDIIFLDKNYNEVKRFSTLYFFDVKKIAVKNNRIYIAGINETTYYPELLILNEKGKLIKKIVIPKKYALVKDLYLDNGNNYILVDIFKDGKSYVEIYKDGKLLKKIELPNSINGNFLFKANNNLFIIGTIKKTTEDAFIMNLNKGWIRFFDLGMDESFDNYKVDGTEIILTLHSTDQMGADSYYEIVIDENGKIFKNKCKMKFDKLPMRFRT